MVGLSLASALTVSLLAISGLVDKASAATTTTTATTSKSTKSTKTQTSAAATSTNTLTSNSSCIVTSFTDVDAAIKSCTNIVLSGFTIPGAATLDLQKLKNGTTVTFSGTTSFEFADADVDLIRISGSNITITAEPGAVIDGNGQAWWDGEGSNGGATKPNHFITLSKLSGNSVIKGLTIQNWPVHCFQITNCHDLPLQDITLNNTAGNAPNARSDGLAAAHNSDGFDVSSSTNIVIQNSVVLNQDDCVAVTSGTNITVSGLYCDGGHGLSIGSVGGKSNNVVANVTFADSVIKNSQNGARIKTNSGTTGNVTGITYRNISLSNITIYGIDIRQDYLNGGPTGTPTNGVTIQGLTFTNITGTAATKATNYYILCGSGSCSDFAFNDINITGGGKPSTCNFKPVGNFAC